MYVAAEALAKFGYEADGKVVGVFEVGFSAGEGGGLAMLQQGGKCWPVVTLQALDLRKVDRSGILKVWKQPNF